MAVKAGRVVINLTAGTAEYYPEMNRAADAWDNVARKANGAGQRMDEVAAKGGRAGRAIGDGMAHGVTGIQGVSGALRVAEGNLNNNIRAAERFLATTLGLGSFFQKIFPVVGSIALLGIFEHLIQKGKQLYDAYKKLEEQPEKIAEGFRAITAPLQKSNDELSVANDKLQNEINKLEGKPRDGLKLALDEAIVSSDALAESLDHTLAGVEKLLGENRRGFLGWAFGRVDTGPIEESQKKLRKQLGDITDAADEKLADLGKRAEDAQKLPDKERIQALKDLRDQGDVIHTKERTDAERVLRTELDAINADLKTRKSLSDAAPALPSKRVANPATVPVDPATVAGFRRDLGEAWVQKNIKDGRMAVGPNAGDSIEVRKSSASIPDEKSVIEDEKGRRKVITRLLTEFSRRALNEKLTEQVEPLRAAHEGEKHRTDPFGNEIAKLDAQLRGVNEELKAAGESESGRLLAKSWAEAQREIEKVNKELRDENPKKKPLTGDARAETGQEGEIFKRIKQIDQEKAQEEFFREFTKGNAAISERIQLQNLLTDAVGKGYEAIKTATVHGELIQSFGGAEKFAEAQRLHPEQVAQRTALVNADYDAKRATTLANENDKLKDQIELEESLANAQMRGANALQLITFAYRLKHIAEDEGLPIVQDLIDKEVSLADAEKRTVDIEKLTRQITAVSGPAPPTVTGPFGATLPAAPLTGEQEQAVKRIRAELSALHADNILATSNASAGIGFEIAAVERLTAAQLGGLKAVRDARLQNQIAEIERTAPASTEEERKAKAIEIERVTQLNRAQYEEQITTEALRTGLAYQNQLQSIDEEITRLHEIQKTQGDTLAIEISLKKLTQERTHILAEQVQVLGSARDGLRAFFQEMAADGKSAAAEVHEALSNAFSSLNDELAKIMSGQKASWQHFFQGISEQLAKQALERIEAAGARGIFGDGQPKTPKVTGPFGIPLPTAPVATSGNTDQPEHHGLRGILDKLFGPTKPGRTGSSPSDAFYVIPLGYNGVPPSSIPGGVPFPAPGVNLPTSQPINNGPLGTPSGDVNGPPSIFQRPSLPAETGLPPLIDVSQLPIPDNSGLFKLGNIIFGVGAGSRPGIGELPLAPPYEGYADGGDVSGNKTILVGEEGPELFVPKTAGTIIPNDKVQAHLSDAVGTKGQATMSFADTIRMTASEIASDTLVPLLSRAHAIPKRMSPLGVPEYVVGGPLEQFIGKSFGGVTDSEKTVYLAGNDTPEVRTHERIHQAQQGLKQPEFEQLVSAFSPAFHGDQKKARDYVYETGIHDGSLTQREVQRDAMFEAPATLFSEAHMESRGKGKAKLEAGQLEAYKNYLALMQRLNPGKEIRFDKVVPPELQMKPPAFALGGEVEANKTIIVGEKGPELFVPQSAGTIESHNTLQSFLHTVPGLASSNAYSDAPRSPGKGIGAGLFSDLDQDGQTDSTPLFVALTNQGAAEAVPVVPTQMANEASARGAGPILQQQISAPASGLQTRDFAETVPASDRNVFGSVSDLAGPSLQQLGSTPGIGENTQLALKSAGIAVSILGKLFGTSTTSSTGVDSFDLSSAADLGLTSPGFAKGGDVREHKTILVGERGPELFLPKTHGTIIPNHRMSAFLKTFGGPRAMGGDVNPSQAYLVGEQGPELMTSAVNNATSSSRKAQYVNAPGGNTYYTINTGGADATLVEKRVNTALRAIHGSAIQQGFDAHQEHVMRTPQHS